jgi:hypothetical protein
MPCNNLHHCIPQLIDQLIDYMMVKLFIINYIHANTCLHKMYSFFLYCPVAKYFSDNRLVYFYMLLLTHGKDCAMEVCDYY